MNIEKLKGHIPDAVLAQIPDTVQKFELNTPLRLAHFLAQCGHESAGFKAVSELKNSGKIRAFGLSNFTPSQTDLIKKYSSVAYNQR